jgi:hypothetical protein
VTICTRPLRCPRPMLCGQLPQECTVLGSTGDQWVTTLARKAPSPKPLVFPLQKQQELWSEGELTLIPSAEPHLARPCVQPAGRLTPELRRPGTSGNQPGTLVFCCQRGDSKPGRTELHSRRTGLGRAAGCCSSRAQNPLRQSAKPTGARWKDTHTYTCTHTAITKAKYSVYTMTLSVAVEYLTTCHNNSPTPKKGSGTKSPPRYHSELAEARMQAS